jgi:sugar lactone lactonase YvrE
MGKYAEFEAGAIYRFYRGELRQVYDRITIPNSICFSPDGEFLYFTDGPKKIIFKQPLDSSGWPQGDPGVFVNLKPEGLIPDGSVVDGDGALWNAQWGSGRVARYRSDGSFDQAVAVPGIHSTCPAFGGKDFKSLLITTAQEHIDKPSERDGLTYCLQNSLFKGLPEPRVQL